MKAVYSDAHRLHDPAYGFARGRQVPYAEQPARALTILKKLREAGFAVVEPHVCDDAMLGAVHCPDYLAWLAGAYPAWVEARRPTSGVIADVFPLRRVRGRSREMSRLSGWYCFDSETPIVAGTWRAARAAAACALTGAEMLLDGERSAYSLCRPPGHHAGRDYCGGYCYLNNAALAADRLSPGGSAAVLDLDYHHGNGTQDILYERGDVLYASLHADPNLAYPYHWGWTHERGAGEGEGCNLNLPLPLDADEALYLEALERAVQSICDYAPAQLVVSLGTDTGADDRLGTFQIEPDGFARMAQMVAGLGLPTLVVQEGGYDREGLGRCVLQFLQGLTG